MRRSRWGALALALCAGAAPSAPRLAAHGAAAPASDYTQINVVITYVRDVHDSADTVTGADFYARVTIGDATTRTPTIEDERTIRPNWAVIGEAPPSAASVPMRIAVWDADGWLNGDDDAFDLDAGNDKPLNFALDVATCTLSGDSGFTGACGAELSSRGDSSGDSAEIHFRVEVLRVSDPTGTGGLYLRCLHQPLWPDVGASVAIQAEAVDARVAAREADAIEIWTSAGLVANCAKAATCRADVVATGDTMSYLCLARAGERAATTSWRQVDVDNGGGAAGAVPVVFTAPSAEAVDIVFVPDRDDYGDANDASFQRQLFDSIWQAYYRARIHLLHQNRLNFWLANDQGDYQELCTHTLPANWNATYAFADAGAIIHRDALRDCARFNQRIFSSEPGSYRTMLHETGHQPFGLADEYCCDGGYFEPTSLPNLYTSVDNCLDDLGDLAWWDLFLGDATGRGCDSFRDKKATTWWRSDPKFAAPNKPCCDIMADENIFRGADARRIDTQYRNLAP